jgi:cell division protein FtsL
LVNKELSMGYVLFILLIIIAILLVYMFIDYLRVNRDIKELDRIKKSMEDESKPKSKIII